MRIVEDNWKVLRSDSVQHQAAEFDVWFFRGDGHDWRRQRRVIKLSACGCARAYSRGCRLLLSCWDWACSATWCWCV